MNRISRFLARPLAFSVLGLGLLLGAGSCATTSRVGVSADFDHSVNFRAYTTWAWYPAQPVDTEGGPAKGYESFLDKRIRTAVEQQLAQKGMSYSEKNPDVYVAYSARVEDKQRANTGAYGPYGYPFGWYGYGGFYNRGGYVTDYKAGTVILDFVDAKRKELAWRGQGQAQVDQQTISEAEVQRIVTSILGNYPPGAEQASR
jgi:Domain of unknown function (DUF4136)